MFLSRKTQQTCGDFNIIDLVAEYPVQRLVLCECTAIVANRVTGSAQIVMISRSSR